MYNLRGCFRRNCSLDQKIELKHKSRVYTQHPGNLPGNLLRARQFPCAHSVFIAYVFSSFFVMPTDKPPNFGTVLFAIYTIGTFNLTH